ncbi:MAG TPA: hypothetical protein VJ124_05205 [Pyrinomonadaceae bacterium]|nr:hypothetical protein [Pyrinomonadaceae bacterium]
MINRHTLKFSILAAAIFALGLPVIAAAQGRYGYPDYRRNRDDGQYGRNGQYGRYDTRSLRDSIHRLDRLAKDFDRDLDRELDRSHEDGTRHEDSLNADARQFRSAVADLKSRFGNGRDLSRSDNEARRVLQLGNRLQRVTSHHFYSGRLASEWSQIRQQLNVIANAYGSYGYNDDDYYRNGRNRRDDDYRRNDRNNDWWRRIPLP